MIYVMGLLIKIFYLNIIELKSFLLLVFNPSKGVNVTVDNNLRF